MKEFIEKLIARLEEKSVEITFPLYPDDSTSFVPITEAITIVNQLAEEYKNGWVPCKKELPKFPNTYLVTKMCEYDGNPIYETAHEIYWGSDGKWDCERDEDCEWKVIAWQNKIAPYRPEGD